MTTVPHLCQTLQTLLTTTADRLARQTGFVQRTSKLTGALFAQTLVFGWLANPHASLEALAQTAAALGVSISAQGLDQRLGEAGAVFLEELLGAAVQTVIAADPGAIPLLQRFSAVELLDSSTIALPAALAPWWPGCTPGSAALKLHVRFDLCRGRLSGLFVREGRTSDRHTPVQTAPLPAGALRVANLGSFALHTVARLRDAFWLSRFYSGTAVFTADGRRWEVLALLEAHGGPQVDLRVELGVTHRLPARLLAVRVPQEVADQRRARLLKRAREKGETPSAASLAACSWLIAVTNVPDLTLNEALVLLRARWQVELLFKLWKSHGQIDTSRSTHHWRVLCEVCAKLLAMVVQHWLLLTGCWANPARSLTKAAQTIRAHALHLASTFACPVLLARTITLIHSCLATGCRLNRRKKAPNTHQLLLDPSLNAVA